jgi:hypothetical protein
LAKLAVKRVRCASCGELVRLKESKAGDKTQFSCIKCNKPVWQKKGLGWKYVKE